MKKTINKHFHVDEKTEERIKKRKEELKVSESEYFRRLVISDTVPIDQKTLNTIARNIYALGNNINQIAHIANMMMLSKEDIYAIEDFKKELVEIKKLFYQLKEKIEGG